MHIGKVGVGAPSVFEQIPGTDKIHVKISGITADVELDGKIYLAYLIPLSAQKVTVSGLSVDITLESTSSDNIHWKLSEASTIDYSNITIDTSSKPLNWVISHMGKQIKKLIVMGMSKGIDVGINDLNAMVAQEKPYSFDVSLMNLTTPLNMTMSMAPSIIKDSHLIKLNFDGLFDKPEKSNQMNYELDGHDLFPSVTESHREQLWIHQNTINSLMKQAYDQFLPLSINTKSISDEILEVFPEVVTKCGKNVSANAISFDLIGDLTRPPFQMTQKDGIRVGNITETEVSIGIQFDKCDMENAALVNETLLSFSANMEATLNFTMQDTVFFLFGKRAWVKNVKLVADKINVTKGADFEMILESIMDAQFEQWNM